MGLFSKLMNWLDEEENNNTNETNDTLDSCKITFGKYDGIPIEWYPVGKLGETGDKLVTPSIEGVKGTSYIVKTALFKAIFNEYDRTVKDDYNIWKFSWLRQYLNGEFYDNCFSDEEKSRIIPCKVRSYSNTKTDAYGELYVDEIETIDKVYIPDDMARWDEDTLSLYWTRMTVSSKDRLHGYLASLGDGGRSLTKKSSSNKVIAAKMYCQSNSSSKEFSSEVMVDLQHDVRPVIFIKDTENNEKPKEKSAFSFNDVYDDEKRREMVRQVMKEYDANKK